MDATKQTAKQLKLNKLCLTRSKQLILRDVDVVLPVPGVTVLLGANGAGKSSLLNVVAGISQPDSGQIKPVNQSMAFLMPEPAVFYPRLSVKEQLMFVAKLSEISDADKCISEALQVWQLESQVNKLTQHLSLGYRQRLSLAQLMVSQADLLLLDEPMNGMDPEVMEIFKQQINCWKQNKTILMATHIMHEAQNMADWVVVMHQGKVIQSTAYQHEIGFNEMYHSALSQYHQTKGQDEGVGG